MNKEYHYKCGCGHRFQEDLGKYGCPDCGGDQVARLQEGPKKD